LRVISRLDSLDEEILKERKKITLNKTRKVRKIFVGKKSTY